MTKKYKSFISAFIFLTIIIIIASLNKDFLINSLSLSKGSLKKFISPNSRIEELKDKFESNLKIVNEQLNSLESKYEYLKKVNEESVSKLEILGKEYLSLLYQKDNLKLKEQLTINSQNGNFKIEVMSYLLPNLSYEITTKPSGYLSKYNDKIFIINSYGEVIYFDYDSLKSNNDIKINRVNSNIKEIITDKRFYTISSYLEKGGARWMSIKGMSIIDNNVYVSFTNTKSKDCYNTSILKSKMDMQYLNFEIFFDYEECANALEGSFHGLQSGGYIEKLDDNNIFFSIGDYRKYKKAQDQNSNFGKILLINLKNKDKSVFSLGHRNPQGIYYDFEKKFVLSTEHGPKGGDEINFQKFDQTKILNFGWPISSYGNHYDGKKKKDAPLHKSHSKYGFIEPLKYYKISPAVSAIEKLITDKPSLNINENKFLVLTMAGPNKKYGQAINLFKADSEKILDHDAIKIDNRLRDIVHLKYNQYLVIGENPSILYFIRIFEN